MQLNWYDVTFVWTQLFNVFLKVFSPHHAWHLNSLSADIGNRKALEKHEEEGKGGIWHSFLLPRKEKKKNVALCVSYIIYAA